MGKGFEDLEVYQEARVVIKLISGYIKYLRKRMKESKGEEDC